MDDTLNDTVEVKNSLFDKAMQRPADYDNLSAENKWHIDKQLGILDWDGNCDHKPYTMCIDCKKRWVEKFKPIKPR